MEPTEDRATADGKHVTVLQRSCAVSRQLAGPTTGRACMERTDISPAADAARDAEPAHGSLRVFRAAELLHVFGL